MKPTPSIPDSHRHHRRLLLATPLLLLPGSLAAQQRTSLTRLIEEGLQLRLRAFLLQQAHELLGLAGHAAGGGRQRADDRDAQRAPVHAGRPASRSNTGT